ncbi:FkbM family methyltransferase [Mucilaginibacter sp. SG538B]|uniref:FkbM family methyltransferase n=1 Tax=Mucilaginibacter sp. SG538B TaxID=2587021 RepID=UPI00159DF7FB|nr:FkbM family methyltransferase [Mucilaginibacter sp. SG538B]NVM63742.1 FkbM family methyltransferase [Mucilaginibacter sp. SG538B]
MNAIKRTVGFILKHPLGKKHPAKALWRFAWWQVQSRLSRSKFIIKPFVGDVKFYATKGLSGITGNIYTGLHEFNDMAFLLHFLKPDDIFFDIGANVGSYTLLASGIAKANSVTLEPVKATFDILNSNIELNYLQDEVKLINAGAGATVGEIRFSADEDTGNHVITKDEKGKNTVIVPIITIDSLLETHKPALIKIDVEGFETEVLKGMGSTLNSPLLKAIIIELNGSGGRYGFSDQDIHKLLLSKGFRAVAYDPFKRVLTGLDTFGAYNTIYCRDIELINHRLQNAKSFNIMGETI